VEKSTENIMSTVWQNKSGRNYIWKYIYIPPIKWRDCWWNFFIKVSQRRGMNVDGGKKSRAYVILSDW